MWMLPIDDNVVHHMLKTIWPTSKHKRFLEGFQVILNVYVYLTIFFALGRPTAFIHGTNIDPLIRNDVMQTLHPML